MPGITLFIDDKHQQITDDNGRFAFPELPAGAYNLKLRGAEIYANETKLKIEAGKQVDTTYYVEVKRRYVTTVRAQRPVEDVIVRVLSQDEIKKIPGTQGDALKAVQNLPGVARAPFGGGQIVVWGSSPQDTRVYADGVVMPTLFNFGGLRSVINSEFLDSLVFMPGGYGTDYGAPKGKKLHTAGAVVLSLGLTQVVIGVGLGVVSLIGGGDDVLGGAGLGLLLSGGVTCAVGGPLMVKGKTRRREYYDWLHQQEMRGQARLAPGFVHLRGGGGLSMRLAF